MSIGDNSVPVNAYNFSEKTGDLQPYITNSLGRTVLFAEFIYQNGFFGNVTDQDGIENGASGYIDINAERIVTTQQIEATDTFTVGNTLWFVSGGSGAAGKFVDADPGSGTRLAVGIITAEEGTAGAQTSVSFRPFVQRLDATDVSAQVTVNTTAIGTLGDLTTTAQTDLVVAINEVDADVATLQAEMLVEQAEPKILVQKVTTGAASIAVTGLSEGDEIIGVRIIPTGNSTNGTITIQDGDANAITDAMTCAVDTTVSNASTIDDAYSTLPAAGALIVCAGDTVANTVAVVVFEYIPA
jgi:hypothetical protein